MKVPGVSSIRRPNPGGLVHDRSLIDRASDRIVDSSAGGQSVEEFRP